MRRILVERAWRHQALKRGGGAEHEDFGTLNIEGGAGQFALLGTPAPRAY